MLYYQTFEQFDIQSNSIMVGNFTLKGIVCLIGAFMITLAVGLMYLWGIIITYATSYFRIISRNASLTENQTNLLFPLTLLGQAISMLLAAKYAKKVSSRLVCLVSGIAMFLITYMASYAESFLTFAVLFGLCNGLVIGVIYILPIAHCFQYYPHKKNTVSAVIISASGLGTLLFSMLASSIINPNNVSLLNGGTSLFFDREIAIKFPAFLQTLSGILLGLVSGGSLLLLQFTGHSDADWIKQLKGQKQNLANLMQAQFAIQRRQSAIDQEPKNPFGNMNYQMTDMGRIYDNKPSKVGDKAYGQKNGQMFWPTLDDSFAQNTQQQTGSLQKQLLDDNQKGKDQNQIVNECPRTRDGPKEFIFWQIFFIIVLGSNFGLMISLNYKSYAKGLIADDRFLTLVGAVGALACGFSRFLWGCFLDKSTFKAIFCCLGAISVVLAFSIPYIVKLQQYYILVIIVAYVCYGGLLGMFPAVSSLIFGVRYGPQIYGLLFFAFAASNFVECLLVIVAKSYDLSWMFSGVMGACAILLVTKLPLTYDWSQRIRENNQRKRLLAR